MKNYFKIVVILLSALAYTSIANAEELVLKNVNDSINYALGLANGDGIAQSQMDGFSEADKKAACKEFLEAMQRGWDGIAEEENAVISNAKDFARVINTFETAGVGEVSVWPINEPLLFQGMIRGLNSDTSILNITAATAYVEAEYAMAQEAPETKEKAILAKKFKDKAKKVKIKTHNDSINFCFGYLFGDQIKLYILREDSTGKDRKLFVSEFNKSLTTKYKYPKLVSFGENLGKQIQAESDKGLLRMSFLSTDMNLLKKGMEDAILAQSVWNSNEAMMYIEATIPALQEAERTRWLTENAQRPGVQVTESGLQYEVIKESEGPKPMATSKVKVHYEGSLTDGTIFDSSYQRGEPITFPLNAVISGWTEGLQLMSVGSIYKLYIPYHLGYGERGAGGVIPPYATLIFVVELLDIE